MSSDIVRDWIADHYGYDWGVLLIDDLMRATLIKEGLGVVRWQIVDALSLSGIHIRDLLVVVDLEGKPQFVKDLVLSAATGRGSKVVSPNVV